MKNIDLKTIFIGIFVFAFIFFEMSERRAKHRYMKMDKHSDWKNKDKYHKVKIGRYVPFNDEYVLDTSTGVVFKPETK
tara:strand:- start:1452 stop:1685 length:234 start_codon:yes stop_codon:yes gene_type:complete